MRKLREEQSGFTLVELSIVTLLTSVIIALAGGFLMSAFRTGVFAESQSIMLNDTRTAVERISREIRGSDDIEWCEPAGSCLQVGAQKPTGGFRTLQYTHSGTDLRRQELDPGTGEWGPAETVIERVANSISEPVFKCDVQSSLLKVNIDLRIAPTPQSGPVLNVQTSVTPRNFPSKANC